MNKSHFDLSTYFNIVIISSFLVFGLTNIFSRLFFTTSPITEILIDSYSIEIIRKGNLIREFYGIQDFKMSHESIVLESGTKRFELDSLELTEEQEAQLTNDLKTLIY